MEISAQLIKKYLRGECTTEEEVFVHRWYQSFEDEENPLQKFSDQQKEQLRQKILHHINDNIQLHKDDAAEKKSYRPVIKVIIATALAVAAIIIFLIIFPWKQQPPVNNPVATLITLVNNSKGLQKEMLPDSSIVWLNANSELKFPPHFSGHFRRVSMDGEAFFEVAKDHAHPFVINSGGVIVKVWGTSFNIKAYKNIPTEVAVVTGKVSVSIPARKHSELMLLPDESVTYIEKQQQLEKNRSLDVQTMKMWQKTSLSFDNVKVEKVVDVLNKKFKVHIVVNDEEINQYLLKADFNNQNLPDILEMLAASLGINYQINNRNIIIGHIEKDEKQAGQGDDENP